MENLFKNAKFGDCFKTRDGRKAIYWKTINCECPNIALLCEDFVIDVLPNGIIEESCFGEDFLNKHDYDIVSRWGEEIDEDKLADKAIESALKYNRNINNTMTPDQEYWYQEGYKTGYRDK